MDLKKWKVFETLSHSFAANVKTASIIGTDSHKNVLGAGGQEMPQCRAGVMAMRNGYPCSIAFTLDDLIMLGVAEFQDCTPLMPVKIDALCGQEIQAISSGLEHVAALTMDGRVYEWGRMHIRNQWKLLKPQIISGNLEGKKVVQVACGRSHTLVLSSDGEAYAWGSNRRAQLGSTSRPDDPQPTRVMGGFGPKIVSRTCGGWTSFTPDDQGNVSRRCGLGVIIRVEPLGFLRISTSFI